MLSAQVPLLPLPPHEPNRADEADWLSYQRAMVAHWTALVAYHTEMLRQAQTELARLERMAAPPAGELARRTSKPNPSRRRGRLTRFLVKSLGGRSDNGS